MLNVFALSHLNVEACHLCYNLTKSTPGFAADPNNCAKFYMCEPNGEGGFNTFPMECPICSFWDQAQLTCVQVWFHPVHCVKTGHETVSQDYTTPSTLHSVYCFYSVNVSIPPPPSSLLLS